MPQFIPIDQIEEVKSRFEEENPYNIEKINELRAIMIAENNDDCAPRSTECDLISLNDIMLKQAGNEHNKETYLQLQKSLDNSDGMNCEMDLTVIVNRLKLTFCDKDCQVLNFTDITI